MKKLVNWLDYLLECLWISLFGYSKQSRDIAFFQHIIRERYPNDPKYPVVQGYWGRKKIFALKDHRGKKYDVKCLLVNNKFVIIDHKDGNKRKYIVVED